MRTRKSIDEAALPRESVYYYNGTQLIFEAQYQAGALLRVLGFQYDPQGSPLYLTLWNNPADAAQYTVYRYQYNLLGEIEKLLLVKSVNGTSVTYPNTEAASYTYSAFGKIMAQSGEMAAINPIRYKGYYYDTETGWYYLQSRYYSPDWGIFLTLDDPGILLEVGEDPLALDLVAYCQNDPVNYSDPSGRFLEAIFNPLWAFIMAMKEVLSLAVATLAAIFIVKTIVSIAAKDRAKVLEKLLGPIAKMLCEDFIRVINDALVKALIRPKDRRRENHHIVAQNSSKAKVAQDMLGMAQISINDPLNLVPVRYYLHKHLHTDLYYFTVNNFMKSTGGNRRKVIAVLDYLRAVILFASQML